MCMGYTIHTDNNMSSLFIHFTYIFPFFFIFHSEKFVWIVLLKFAFLQSKNWFALYAKKIVYDAKSQVYIVLISNLSSYENWACNIKWSIITILILDEAEKKIMQLDSYYLFRVLCKILNGKIASRKIYNFRWIFLIVICDCRNTLNDQFFFLFCH